MKYSLFILFILLVFSSCGKNTSEELADTVLNANIELSKGNCQSAIDILEAHGRANDNAHYLKALASAYACRAGYSSTTFFVNDLVLTATPTPLGGTSIYSTSLRTWQSPLENDPRFSDLNTAITILLYAGGIATTTEPYAIERAKYFTTQEAGDINTQLLYMELVQLGTLLHVYGNGSAAGVKGSTVTSKCLTSYSVWTHAPTAGGACSATNKSFSETDIAIDPVSRKRRLCHGIILLNGIIDLLPSVVASVLPASQQAGVSASLTAITGFKTAAANAAVLAGVSGQVFNTQNQTACENNSIVPVLSLEIYYAEIMEAIFK